MPEVFSLSELAKEWTNGHPEDPISPRTLRYYISVMLLEGPGRVGPGKHYGKQHLKRLEIIRLMQENGRTIDDIRSLLAGFGADQVDEVIQEQQKLLQARRNAEYRLLGSSTSKNEELSKVGSILSDEPLELGGIFKGIKTTWKHHASKQVPLEGIPWIRVNITLGLEVLIREDLMTNKGDDVMKWMRDGSTLFGTGEEGNE